jgi:hypothetical protein
MAVPSREERHKALLADIGIQDPGPPYIAVKRRCWRPECGVDTVVFFWPGIGVGREPPKPRPATVKIRYSNTVRTSYWSNGCHVSDALIGDWFLQDIFLDTLTSDPNADDHWELFFPSPGLDSGSAAD